MRPAGYAMCVER